MTGNNGIQTRGLVRRAFQPVDSEPIDLLPVKAYVLAANFDRVYGTAEEALIEASNAEARARINRTTGRLYLFGIAFPWGYMEHGGPVRKVDFYGFDFDKPWSECNPEWTGYVFRNGVFQKESSGCEIGLIILGKECEQRRQIIELGRDLEAYLNTWCDISNLGLVDSSIHYLRSCYRIKMRHS